MSKVTAKPPKIDMSVTTDDLINIHVSRMESQLLQKQSDYQNLIRDLKKQIADKEKVITGKCEEWLKKQLKKIPASLAITGEFDGFYRAQSGIVIHYTMKTMKGLHRLNASAEVVYSGAEIPEFNELKELEKQSNDAMEKLALVGKELGFIPVRERQVRAEISRRKLEQIDGIENLLDLSDVNNPLLSLPSNL